MPTPLSLGGEVTPQLHSSNGGVNTEISDGTAMREILRETYSSAELSPLRAMANTDRPGEKAEKNRS